jgi:hypothetical protein
MNKIGLVLLLAAACNGDDTGSKPSGDTSTPPAAGFTILGDGAVLPSAILSIWGSSQDDVFLVGGDDGTGPLVVHWDGAAWSRLDTGTTGDLWWVWSPGGDTVFFSGAAGRMVRYSRSAGTFTEEAIASASYVMFGTWGTSETDVWSVGGDVVNGVLDGAIQHYDGTTWSSRASRPRAARTTPRSARRSRCGARARTTCGSWAPSRC